jgi:hypothetical protein
MRESLLSSLKVVAMMLATDNDLHPNEAKWFWAVTKNYGASFTERRILDKYLKGENEDDLEMILDRITDEFDRRKLLNFVQMAMRQDGLVKNSEIELFHEIHRLLDSRGIANDYRNMGRELQKRDKDLALWRALGQLGKLGSVKLRGFTVWGYSPLVTILSQEDTDILMENKAIMILALGLLLIFIGIVYLATLQ